MADLSRVALREAISTTAEGLRVTEEALETTDVLISHSTVDGFETSIADDFVMKWIVILTSIVLFVELVLGPRQFPQQLAPEEVQIAPLAPEDFPLLQSILGVLATQSSHFDHFVLAEFVLSLKFLHCPKILVFLSLSIQHLSIPLSNFFKDACVCKLLHIKSIVAEGLFLIPALLEPESP